MNTTKETDQITLYFRQGSSDKVYQARIESAGDGYLVNFAFGRRGSTFQTGTKTAKPVDYEAARKIFEGLVREKQAKGYTQGPDGTPYQSSDKSERVTGILPQLCNAIDEAELDKLLSDEHWVMQEKFDGKRVMIRKTDGKVVGINRSGLIIALPESISGAVSGLEAKCLLIDGEAIGDTYVAFDLLEFKHLNFRSRPYCHRIDRLTDLLQAARSPHLRHAPVKTTTREKNAFLAELRKRKAEGAVFKRSAAGHSVGRPASSGDWRKFKFVATASCIVAGANGTRRSVGLQLLDGGKRISVGNVTIPPAVDIPDAGSVVEVRYLYANPGGSLQQPVYLGCRDDQSQADCKLGQLKFKAGLDGDESA